MCMKKVYRNLLISLFFLSIISITIPLVLYNLNQRNPDRLSIIIKGNVSHEVTYYYDDITNGTYGIVENRPFTFLNEFGLQYDVNYSGVSVWALLTYSSILTPSSTAIYFYSWDNYQSATLSLTDVENHSEEIIIAFKKEDAYLKNDSQDGGPLRSIVNLSVTEPIYCSQYWVKYVNMIVVE